MHENGEHKGDDLPPEWSNYLGAVERLRATIAEVDEQLARVHPDGTPNADYEDMREWVEDLFETTRDSTASLVDGAEALHHAHIEVAPDLIDPVRHVEEHVGNEYQDGYARSVWKQHEGCSADELQSIAEKLNEITQSLRSQIAEDLKAGDDPPKHLIDEFLGAYSRRPIIDHMLEQAALNGPTPPSWDEVRWRNRVRLCLRGNSASHDTLRCLYFLLVQQERDFGNVTALHRTVAELMQKGRPAVSNALRRGIDLENTSELKDWDEMPSTLDGYRQWLQDHPSLSIDL